MTLDQAFLSRIIDKQLGFRLIQARQKMPTTMIRSKVKYKKISDDDGYIDAQV